MLQRGIMRSGPILLYKAKMNNVHITPVYDPVSRPKIWIYLYIFYNMR